MSLFFGFVVGLVVGWNLPQPKWAADLWDKLKAKFSGN